MVTHSPRGRPPVWDSSGFPALRTEEAEQVKTADMVMVEDMNEPSLPANTSGDETGHRYGTSTGGKRWEIIGHRSDQRHFIVGCILRANVHSF